MPKQVERSRLRSTIMVSPDIADTCTMGPIQNKIPPYTENISERDRLSILCRGANHSSLFEPSTGRYYKKTIFYRIYFRYRNNEGGRNYSSVSFSHNCASCRASEALRQRRAVGPRYIGPIRNLVFCKETIRANLQGVYDFQPQVFATDRVQRKRNSAAVA